MALTPKEIEEALNLLKKQAEQQQEINSGLDSYIKALAKAKSIQESINTNIKIENEIKRNELNGNELTQSIKEGVEEIKVNSILSKNNQQSKEEISKAAPSKHTIKTRIEVN